MVVTQGRHITHRIAVPLDVVTAASPDAIDGVWDGTRVVDVVSGPSRVVEAGSLDLTSSYRPDEKRQVYIQASTHVENPFRSWNAGVGGSRIFADGNTTVSGSISETYDWFDQFDIHGDRVARTNRLSSNGNLALTQLLTPTTIVNLNYGLTVQVGTLGNTWNSVPFAGGTGRGPEILPSVRQRHALVGRLAQWLPWRGALHGYYRFYADDWGLVGNTFEVELYQRFTSWLYLRANYRVHVQNGVRFFTTAADESSAALRTADSDLAPFVAQTIGGKVAIDLRFWRRLRGLHADLGFERYFRSNNLYVNLYTCALGFLF
jgi:hypothetical protein